MGRGFHCCCSCLLRFPGIRGCCQLERGIKKAEKHASESHSDIDSYFNRYLHISLASFNKRDSVECAGKVRFSAHDGRGSHAGSRQRAAYECDCPCRDRQHSDSSVLRVFQDDIWHGRKKVLAKNVHESLKKEEGAVSCTNFSRCCDAHFHIAAEPQACRFPDRFRGSLCLHVCQSFPYFHKIQETKA